MPGEEDHKRDEGARTKAATAGAAAGSGKLGGALKFHKNSPFLNERAAIWDELFAKQVEVYKGYDRNPIKITLPDGAVKDGTSFESSPFTVAKAISSQLAKSIIVAKVRYTKKRA
jgi:threonyl-tRNA synthetase